MIPPRVNLNIALSNARSEWLSSKSSRRYQTGTGLETVDARESLMRSAPFAAPSIASSLQISRVCSRLHLRPAGEIH